MPDSGKINPVSSIRFVNALLSRSYHRTLTFVDEIANDDAFCKIRDWIYSVLNTHSHIESFYELFSRNKEFWIMLPDIMWALSWRRLVVVVLFLIAFTDL